MKKLSYSKGQVSETMTWFAATIVIIIILVISISVVKYGLLSIKSLSQQSTNEDIIVTKSFTAYLLTEDTYNVLNRENPDPKIVGKIPGEYENLSRNIFKIYVMSGISKDISGDMWLGVVGKDCLFQSGCSASVSIGGMPVSRWNVQNMVGKSFFYNNIQLNDKSFVELLVKLK